MRHVLIILILSGLAAMAPAQDFTWTGWGGPEWTNPAWGHHWTDDNNYFHNGWGHTWYWDQDPEPHFPGPGSWVLIPDGAVVDVEGGQLAICASLTVAPSGLLQIPYSTVVINGPTLHNDGLIQLISYTATPGTFEVNGPLEIVGEGEIAMASGRFSNWSTLDITIGPSQFIHGAGTFGWLPYGDYHGVNLVNTGHIQAANPDSPLDIYGLQVTNTGTVSATGGGMLRIWGDWDNAGGELVATDGGVVFLAGGSEHPARLEGGHLRTSGGGEIWPDNYGSIKNVTNEGTFHIRRHTGIHMSDTITNLGLIDQGTDGWAGAATIHVDSALTFLGDGVLRMGDANPIQMYHWPDHNARVTNGPDHTIESHGGAFGTAPNYYGDQRIELVNEGTIVCQDAAYGCRFNLAGEGLVNRGDLVLEPAAAVNAELWGDFRQDGGRLITDDGFVIHDGTFAFTGGILAGQGYLQGAVSLGDQAVIHPGGQEQIGTLDIYGPLTLTHGATLVCEWAGIEKDRLAVHGLLAATGTVRLRVVYVELDPGKSVDYVVLSCDEIDDQATWQLELPDGWDCEGLEWDGPNLVIRGVTGAPTAVADTPAALALHGAAPNPFNPQTTVHYSLDRDGPIRLWIADVAGRRIRTLVDGHRAAGRHAVAWNGRDDAGRSVGSGTYLCVLEAAAERRTSRMTLVR